MSATQNALLESITPVDCSFNESLKEAEEVLSLNILMLPDEDANFTDRQEKHKTDEPNQNQTLFFTS